MRPAILKSAVSIGGDLPFLLGFIAMHMDAKRINKQVSKHFELLTEERFIEDTVPYVIYGYVAFCLITKVMSIVLLFLYFRHGHPWARLLRTELDNEGLVWSLFVCSREQPNGNVEDIELQNLRDEETPADFAAKPRRSFSLIVKPNDPVPTDLRRHSI